MHERGPHILVPLVSITGVMLGARATVPSSSRGGIVLHPAHARAFGYEAELRYWRFYVEECGIESYGGCEVCFFTALACVMSELASLK